MFLVFVCKPLVASFFENKTKQNKGGGIKEEQKKNLFKKKPNYVVNVKEKCWQSLVLRVWREKETNIKNEYKKKECKRNSWSS